MRKTPSIVINLIDTNYPIVKYVAMELLQWKISYESE